MPRAPRWCSSQRRPGRLRTGPGLVAGQAVRGGIGCRAGCRGEGGVAAGAGASPPPSVEESSPATHAVCSSCANWRSTPVWLTASSSQLSSLPAPCVRRSFLPVCALLTSPNILEQNMRTCVRHIRRVSLGGASTDSSRAAWSRTLPGLLYISVRTSAGSRPASWASTAAPSSYVFWRVIAVHVRGPLTQWRAGLLAMWIGGGAAAPAES